MIWCFLLKFNISVYTTIISNIQKSLGKGSEWSIVSAIDHYINISKYNYLAGSSYTKLPKELDHPKKLVFKTLMIINASKCV